MAVTTAEFDDIMSGRIHGCFDTIEKAEGYANGSKNIAVMELEIA
jgi:hypothetical protein